MRRKFVFAIMLGVLCLSLTACSGSPTSSTAPVADSSSAPSSEAISQTLPSSTVYSQAESIPSATESPSSEPPKQVDLSGDWKQVDGNSETNYQTATIQGDSIEIYWVNEEQDTKSLYWAGSCTITENAGGKFTWDSKNDTEKTGKAMLASGDDIKTFTYDNGKISYEVTAMGMTQTVSLEKQ